jgi:hypothetical protein
MHAQSWNQGTSRCISRRGSFDVPSCSDPPHFGGVLAPPIFEAWGLCSRAILHCSILPPRHKQTSPLSLVLDRLDMVKQARVFFESTLCRPMVLNYIYGGGQRVYLALASAIWISPDDALHILFRE